MVLYIIAAEELEANAEPVSHRADLWSGVEYLRNHAAFKLKVWNLEGALHDLDQVDVQVATDWGIYAEVLLLQGTAKEYMLDTQGAIDAYTVASSLEPLRSVSLRRLAHVKIRCDMFQGALNDLIEYAH